jgi:predicted NAD-dependent protein-ADP-ribosyltransferase YbiA (DUF1768 family)
MITVKNNKEIPYGVLHLTDAPFLNDGVLWKSPCHFILSSLFPASILRQSVAKSVNVLESFKDADEKFHTHFSSISEFVNIKCEKDSVFKNALLKTGNSKLISPSFAKNIYGKILEQKRTQLQATDTMVGNLFQRSEDPIYYMYLAERALKELLAESNLQNLVDHDFPRMSDLLRHLEKTYGRDRIFKKAPDRATILQIHKKRKVDYTTNPNALIRLVRRQNVRRVMNQNINKLKEYLYTKFIESIKHAHPAVVYERDEIIAREKIDINFKKTVDFVGRIYALFNNNAIFRDEQVAIREKFFIMTEEEILKYETEIFPLHPCVGKKNCVSEPAHSDAAVNEQILDVNTIATFNPYAVNYITISGFEFPTLIHYCIFKGILNESFRLKPKQVYEKIMGHRAEQIVSVFKTWREKNRLTKIEILLDQTLRKFFQGDLQHLLLSTKECQLKIDCPWFPKLEEKLMDFRKTLQPRIYKISSIAQIRSLDNVKKWISSTSDEIEFIVKIFNNWFLAKKIKQEIKIGEILQFIFCKVSTHNSVEEYIAFCLQNILQKYHTDLEINAFIYQMKFSFSNRWVHRENIPRLANENFNSFVTAICKLLIIFDRISKTPTLISDLDVEFAVKIILREDNENYSLLQNETSSDSENADDSEDEVEFNEDEYLDHFEGQDKIYKFLLNNCFNNLSENIENAIFENVSKVKINQYLRNRINFFSY